MFKTLTEPDEQITADDIETLSLDRLPALPMEDVKGRSLDADVIWKTVERAATDTTSVHYVVENTDETPDDDETVMDLSRCVSADAWVPVAYRRVIFGLWACARPSRLSFSVMAINIQAPSPLATRPTARLSSIASGEHVIQFVSPLYPEIIETPSHV
jgi:hypothetical protein